MRKERVECAMLSYCRVVVLKYHLSVTFESELLNDRYGAFHGWKWARKGSGELGSMGGQGPISGCVAAMVMNWMNYLRSCSL